MTKRSLSRKQWFAQRKHWAKYLILTFRYRRKTLVSTTIFVLPFYKQSPLTNACHESLVPPMCFSLHKVFVCFWQKMKCLTIFYLTCIKFYNSMYWDISINMWTKEIYLSSEGGTSIIALEIHRWTIFHVIYL